MKMIDILNLSKIYGKSKESVIALDNINISVDEGEIFGLIGADGAGKTTLFRILTSLLLPDKGCATVVGFDVVRDYKQIRKSIGYMPGKFSLYPDLTIEENLIFFATLFGTTISENYYLIRDIYEQIEPFKNRAAGKLSGGMKQKLALCCALIHRPKVLFLDEPTTGIDPISRVNLWDMLHKLKRESITVLVSTPYMDEAMKCDRIALMNKGSVLQIDSPKNIESKSQLSILEIETRDKYLLLRLLQTIPSVENSYAFGEYLHIVGSVNQDDIRIMAEREGITVSRIRRVTPSIEDCFISETLRYSK